MIILILFWNWFPKITYFTCTIGDKTITYLTFIPGELFKVISCVLCLRQRLILNYLAISTLPKSVVNIWGNVLVPNGICLWYREVGNLISVTQKNVIWILCVLNFQLECNSYLLSAQKRLHVPNILRGNSFSEISHFFWWSALDPNVCLKSVICCVLNMALQNYISASRGIYFPQHAQ